MTQEVGPPSDEPTDREDDSWPYIEKYEAALRDDPALTPGQYALRQFPEALRQELAALHLLYQAALPAAAAPAPVPAGAIPGFVFLGELGRGGMGIVRMARQERPNRVVALKVLPGGADAGPEALERFRREAESAAKLQHPNILSIYQVGEDGGQPFLVLEYAAGGSLKKQLDGTPQPARPAARLVETLARAVHHAHKEGIIHRDLKPANILLQDTESGAHRRAEGPDATCSGADSLSSGRWIPKIADFGLSKRLDGAAGTPDTGSTRTGAVVGTPSYMAPEQAAGRTREIGPAVDVYALGAILYEMLTGRPPFRGETAAETERQVIAEDPVPPARLNANVPRDLETICLKCLHKDSQKRYATAEDLAEDLRRFADGRPILARRSGLWERGVKWARRRPTAAALAAVVTLAVLAFLVGGLWHEVTLREAAERARQKEALAAANLQIALDAIEPLSLLVSGTDFAKIPDRQFFRNEFSQHSQDFYQKLHKLAADHESNDPQVQRNIGRAWHGLGISHVLRGEGMEAEKAFLQAVAVQGKLVEGFPAETAWRVDLAITYQSLGDLYAARGAKESAGDTYAKIIPIFDSLPPSINRVLNFTRLSQKLWVMGRTPEALHWANRVVDYLEPLVQEETSPDRRQKAATALAAGYGTRGLLRVQMEQWAAAIPDIDRALAVKDAKLPAEFASQLKQFRAICAVQSALKGTGTAK
jgi:tetratricopeptide (TPR) repeat protein